MLRNFLSAPGSLNAVAIFLFLGTQEVSGLSAVRSIAELMLVVVALREILGRLNGGRQLVANPLYSTALLFVLSAVLSCIVSPLPAVSFDELKMPLLKGMVVLPLVLSVAILGLVRRDWSEERIAHLLILSMAVSGLGQLVWVLFSYFRYFHQFASFPTDPFFHRFKVGAVLVVFPFVLASMRSSIRFEAWLMKVVAAGLLLVVVTSNARGAWLGCLVSLLYLYVINWRAQDGRLNIDRRRLVLNLAFVVLALGLLAGTPLVDTLVDKVRQGFDTSSRFGNGVWGATLDMIRQSPWLGYGYGDEVYALAYNALAPTQPDWIVRESIGAHNAILAHMVAVGLFGLLTIFLLYLGFLSGARRLLDFNRGRPVVQNMIHASVAAMIAVYLVRGQFEIVRWNSYGVLMALLLWLFALDNAQRYKSERLE